MEITGNSGKVIKLTIFHGKMHAADEEINSVADLVKLKLGDGTVTPAIRFWDKDGVKVCMPIPEETKKRVSSWYELHTCEEALVCNYNFITE